MTDQQQPDATTTSPAGVSNTDSGNAQPEKTVPYDRFAEVTRERKRLETELKKFQDAEAEAQRKAAVDRGDFDKVMNELKPKADRADKLEQKINQYLQTELETIPEQFRDLIPEQMDAADRLTWIQQAKAKGLFGTRTAPNLDAGTTGDRPESLQLTPEELALCRKMNIKPEDFARNKPK